MADSTSGGGGPESGSEYIGLEQHYVDGVLTTEPDTVEWDSLQLFTFVGDEDSSQSLSMRHYGFSTEELMCQFGDSIGVPIRLGCQVGDHLATYAADNGIIGIYEETDTVPQSFLDYQEAYISSNFPVTGTEPNPSVDLVLGIGVLFKGLAASGGAWGYGRALHFMPPTWNNAVSSFTPLYLYGFTAFYDQSFYRARMRFVWSTGFSNISFWPGTTLGVMNDRTSSLLAS